MVQTTPAAPVQGRHSLNTITMTPGHMNMHTLNIDRLLLSAGRRIAADSCSLIFLNRLHLLEPYARVHRIVLTQALYDEITRAPGAAAHAEDRSLYAQLFAGSVLTVPPRGDSVPQGRAALSAADRTLIQAFYTLKPDGILTDDKKVCLYCRRRGIPFMNTPMALFALLHNGAISRTCYTAALHKLYAMGRYGTFVRRHMEEVYLGYCTHTPVPAESRP